MIKVKKITGVFYNESATKKYQGKADRCFYIVYKTPNKKLVWEKVGWASEGYTPQMAAVVRGEKLREIRHGQYLPKTSKNRLTVREAWKEYDNWLKTGKKHPEDDRSRYKAHIEPQFGDTPLSAITTNDLEKFKASLLEKEFETPSGKKRKLSPATVKHVLVIIRQIYNKMIAWGLWKGGNPIKGVKLPTLSNRRERFLTHQEADILLTKLKAVSRQLWEMSLMGLHTGMRAGEICGLRWGDVDSDNGVINIPDSKSGRPRHVYMSDAVKIMLSEKEKTNPGELVFQARGGGKIKDISRAFYRAVEDLGFNKNIEDRRRRVTFHTLRHTFASWLALQGTPIIEIKELLGQPNSHELSSHRYGQGLHSDWAEKRPLWAEIHDEDWEQICRMIRAIRDHKVWGERVSTEIVVALASTRQRDWEDILLKGTLPGRQDSLLPPLDQNYIFKSIVVG